MFKNKLVKNRKKNELTSLRSLLSAGICSTEGGGVFLEGVGLNNPSRLITPAICRGFAFGSAEFIMKVKNLLSNSFSAGLGFLIRSFDANLTQIIVYKNQVY